MIQILKVIVGSQAHGLANENSDYDYRGVYVVPTSELLSLGKKLNNTSWIEGKEDNTSWEIGHFLNLAIHCNPTILETFLAPFAPEITKNMKEAQLASELRALFPYIWNSKDVANAFVGYGINQRKKFLENKDNRRAKYAVAYLRVLYNAVQLLRTGTFSVDMRGTPVYNTLKRWKSGEFTIGEVVGEAEEWVAAVRRIEQEIPEKKADLEPVNKFLLKIRKEFWD